MDANQRGRIDDLLFAVTQTANGGVQGLLDSVYGFLQRKTDFYYEAEPGDNMGFPPGVAESMVYQFFAKYQQVHQQKFPPKPETRTRWEEYEKEQKAKKVEDDKQKKEEAEKKKNQPIEAATDQVKKTGSEADKVIDNEELNIKKKKVPPVNPPKPQSESVKKMSEMSTYNGAALDKYSWSQNATEINVQIPIPEGTSAKQLDIKIDVKKLFVKIKSQNEPIIMGDFQEKVKIDDCFWSIEDKKYINITLEKAYEAIWKGLIKGDAEIDPKKVDNSKRLEEFDEMTQGHLHQVLYEQERKRNGLPTTEEEKNQKAMAQIIEAQKNSGNNPYAGLPYDPDKYGKQMMGSGSGPAPPFKH